MSLFTLLSTAVAVPMLVVLAAFLWFLIRAQIAGGKKTSPRPAVQRPAPASPLRSISRRTGKHVLSETAPAINLSAGLQIHEEPSATFASIDTETEADLVSYQPLSSYLGISTFEKVALTDNQAGRTNTLISGITSFQFDVKDIPGINGDLEKELYDLGYTSVEQIARWGRADVRAVSATLGIDQQKIEDEWIAGARLILSIR